MHRRVPVVALFVVAALCAPNAAQARRRAVSPPAAVLVGANDLISAPVPADVAITHDAPRTAAIVAMTNRLGGDPLRIFNEVRSTIFFEPYLGSRKGGELTLHQQSGSALDIANLLASSFRASGYPTRYARGRVVATAERMRDWIGASSAGAAVEILRAGGIPATLVAGDRVEFEHAWVSVYIGGRWIQLDASFKKIVAHKPSLRTTGPTPLVQFRAEIEATGALDVELKRTLYAPRIPSATNPDDYDRDVDLIDDRLEKSLARAADLATAHTDPREAYGYTEIIAEPLALMREHLPLVPQSAVVGSSFVPSELRAYLTVNVRPHNVSPGAFFRASLPELAGKRITIFPVPATPEDQALVDSRGGTLLAAPSSLRVAPVIYVDGREVARAPALAMREQGVRALIFERPGLPADRSENDMHLGDAFCVVIDYGRTSAAEFETARDLLIAAMDSLPLLNASAVFDERVNGPFLHAAGVAFYAQRAAYRELTANLLGVRWAHATAGTVMRLMHFDFRTPAINPSDLGLGFDMRGGLANAWSETGDAAALRAFRGFSGAMSSALEHHTWEIVGMRSVSAVRVLTLAMKRGIPIRHGITKANWLQISSSFQTNITVLHAVTDAVFDGKVVTLPERDISIGDWRGTGYVITDPATNASTYWVTGGFGGGLTIDGILGVGGGLLAGYNLAKTGGAIVTGFMLAASGGVLLPALGVGLVTLAALSYAEQVQDITDYLQGNTSAEDFFVDQLANAALDKILGKILDGRFDELLGGELTPQQIDAFDDLLQHNVEGYSELLADWSNQSRRGVVTQAVLTRNDFLRLAMHSASPRMWGDLASIRKARGWAPVENLVRNEHYIGHRSIESVVRAIAGAPQAPGVDALILEASTGPSYTAAYALFLAQYQRNANNYRRSYAVTYTPVTGFTAGGDPVFGPPRTETLTVPVEMFLGQWYFPQHAPVGRSDRRAWNTVMKLKAGIEAGFRSGATIWAAGGVDARLREWARVNAPAVGIGTFHNDSLR